MSNLNATVLKNNMNIIKYTRLIIVVIIIKNTIIQTSFDRNKANLHKCNVINNTYYYYS